VKVISGCEIRGILSFSKYRLSSTIDQITEKEIHFRRILNILQNLNGTVGLDPSLRAKPAASDSKENSHVSIHGDLDQME